MTQPKVYWVASKDETKRPGVLNFVLITHAVSVGYLTPAVYQNFLTLSIDARTAKFYANDGFAVDSVLMHRSQLIDDVVSGDWQKHRVKPPEGSDMSFARELARRSLNYQRNARDIYRVFTDHDGMYWVKSLFKAAGVSTTDLRRVGTFWRRDFTAGPFGFPLELFSDRVSHPDLPPNVDEPQLPAPVKGQRTHTVQPGDWLSKIAIAYYGDMNKWSTIYNYPPNKRIIGLDPNIIQPGQVLVIP